MRIAKLGSTIVAAYLIQGASMLAWADPAQLPPSAVERVQTAPNGTTFTLAAGWSLEHRGKVLVAIAPQGAVHFAVIDAGAASDGKAAIAQAWALYRPEFARQPKLIVDQPAVRGWDNREWLN